MTPSCSDALISWTSSSLIGCREGDYQWDVDSIIVGEDARAFLTDTLRDRASVREVRGLGLMIGIEFAEPERCLATCRTALEHGVITLPSGPSGSVLSITPALNIERDVFFASLKTLCEIIQ